MLTQVSDFNQMAIVVIIGFSIGFLGRRFAGLVRYFIEHVIPTNIYYALEFVMVFVLAISGWTLVEIANGPDLPFAAVAVIAGLLAGGITYYRLSRETGCPGCKDFRPFRRQERQRIRIRTEERKAVTRNYRRLTLNLRKPYVQGERSWDSKTVAVYNFYKVRYRCASCRHEWEIEEPKFISRREETHELPPETNRGGRGRS
jgi:hypothetical protein